MIDQSQQNQNHIEGDCKLCNHYYFYYENDPPLQTFTSLYQKCMTIVPVQSNAQKHMIPFNFDTIFSIERDNNTEEQIRTHCGKALGIKIEFFYQSFSLRSQSPQVIQIWNKQLGKVLNQKNFHQLFQARKKVGKGGFASVYLVTKLSNKKNYAVKAFSKETQYEVEMGKESIENEIKIMRDLDHKNLMKIEGVYESQNSIYMCVQYLSGGSLYKKIKQKHKFSPEEVKTIMKSLCEGVAAMHEKNIMHRDLKPDNILLRDQFDFNCVIGDFGLATYADQQYIHKRCGTPGYVAPEISNLRKNDEKYSPVCDIFSLGVVFHIITLNNSPFPARELDELLLQNRQCKIDFQAPQYKILPPEWLDLMKKMLQKNPKKRITAKQALLHNFFMQENPDIPEELSVSSKSHQQCESPLMMSKNPKRRRNMRLRDDSCLKFKMKENMMEDAENSENVDRINSPIPLSKKIHRQRNERKCQTFHPSNFKGQ